MIRRFKNIRGFGDNTDYVEVCDYGSFLVQKDGRRVLDDYWTLKQCLKAVKDGHWVEISDNKRVFTNNLSKKVYSNIGVAKGSIKTGHNVKNGDIVTITEYELVPVKTHKFKVVFGEFVNV